MIGKAVPILLFLLVILGAILILISPIQGLIFYIVIASAVWIYAKPLLGFYLAFLMAPLDNISFVYDSPLRTISEKYSVVIFPVLLTSLVLIMRKIVKDDKKDSQSFSNINVLLFLIFVWTAITYLWTIDPYHGINKIYEFGIGLVIYSLTISFIRDKEGLERVFKILIPWGLILATILFLSNKVDMSRFSAEITNDIFFQLSMIVSEQRPGGFAPPQRASNILSFFFFIGIALYPKTGKYIKIPLFLIGLFLISDILSTGSKGGIGAFLLGMLSFIFFYPGVRKKVISLTSLFLFCVVSIFIFNLIVFRSDRLVSSAEQSELSLSYRLEFWKTGLDMMSNRWIGAGVGGFGHLVDPWPGAHSFYFSILFDLGIVGSTMFFLLIAYVLYRLGKSIVNTKDEDMKRYLYCMGCSFIVFLVHGLVDLTYEMTFFWMLIGTIMAVINISAREQKTATIDERRGI